MHAASAPFDSARSLQAESRTAVDRCYRKIPVWPSE
jgi:hypothetical protein